MRDLIDRQVAIAALERNILDPPVLHDAIATIRELPSAQPEIIRCKECKYFHENVFGDEIGLGRPFDVLIVGHCGCDRFVGKMIYMNPDGFCSFAERL